MSFSRTADDLMQRTRAALSIVPSPVVVVTAYVGARPWGVTASSFTSVTLEPPTISVCLFSQNPVVEAARAQGRMGISVLTADQVSIAKSAAAAGAAKYLDHACGEDDAMADPGSPVSPFVRRWDPHDGMTVPAAPAVHGALAHFDCWVTQTVHVGDHHLLLGSVAEVRSGDPSRQALVYADRNFYSIAEARPLGR
jgi:flavin reductase (DIM6/NTAB) family NADH-FMN oxidoreductase RutF